LLAATSHAFGAGNTKLTANLAKIRVYPCSSVAKKSLRHCDFARNLRKGFAADVTFLVS
jgi:hypothetical protein